MDAKQLENLTFIECHFLTLQKVLEFSGWPLNQFLDAQKKRIIPRASFALHSVYQAANTLKPLNWEEEKTFYPYGFLSWLAVANLWAEEKQALHHFKCRYQNQLDALDEKGWKTADTRFGVHFDDHIQQEWEHFLKGTYGICTRTGTPEEIAIKALGLRLIEPEEEPTLDRKEVLKALNLCVSPFAPGHYEGSSRQKLIDSLQS